MPPSARHLLLLLCLLLGVPVSNAVAQTIPNPSFEANAAFAVSPGYVSGNTAIVGWTASPTDRVGLTPGGGQKPFADNGAIPQGTRVAFIQSDSGIVSTLSTTITGLVAGTHYRVQFRANQRSGTVSGGSV